MSTISHNDDKTVSALYMVSSLAGGGAERTGVNLVKYIDPAEVDFRIALLYRRGDYLEQTPAESVLSPPPAGWLQRMLSYLPRSGFGTVRHALALRALLKQHKPDLLITTIEGMHFVAYLALRMMGRDRPRWVIREGNNTSASLSGNRKLKLVRHVYAHADAYLAISSGLKELLASQFDLTPDKIDVIFNPVDIETIEQKRGEPLGQTVPTPFLLAAGRLHPQKGLDVLLRAFQKIARQLPHQLVLVGQGPLEDELKALATELGIADRVTFVGFQQNPWKWMAAADVVVVSSRYEGFCHVVVEALACGAAVVSTRCDFGPAEVLEEGRYGEITPIEDADALAEGVLNLLGNPDRMAELRQQGPTRAAQFSAAAIAGEYTRYIKRIADGPRDAGK